MYADWTFVMPNIDGGVHRCNGMGCIAKDSMYITLLQHLYVQVVLLRVLNELLNNTLFTCCSINMSMKKIWEI